MINEMDEQQRGKIPSLSQNTLETAIWKAFHAEGYMSSQCDSCTNIVMKTILPISQSPKQEYSHPLNYCTYLDNDGNRKFLTDFIPQVIASYEMNIRRYQTEKCAGAVYKAMEDALTEHFLSRMDKEEAE